MKLISTVCRCVCACACVFTANLMTDLIETVGSSSLLLHSFYYYTLFWLKHMREVWPYTGWNKEVF